MVVRGRRDTEMVAKLHFASMTICSFKQYYDDFFRTCRFNSVSGQMSLLYTHYKTKTATETSSTLSISLDVSLIRHT